MAEDGDCYARVKKKSLKLKVDTRVRRKVAAPSPPPAPEELPGEVDGAAAPPEEESIEDEIKRLVKAEGLTRAERTHRLAQIYQRRRLETDSGHKGETHKERVEKFNKKLQSLSEHFDVPKVGPG